MLTDATASATLKPAERWPNGFKKQDAIYRVTITANGGRSRLSVEPSMLLLRPVKGDAYQVRTQRQYAGSGRARQRLNHRTGTWGVIPASVAEALNVYGVEIDQGQQQDASTAWKKGEFTAGARQVHGWISGGYGIPLLYTESETWEDKPPARLIHLKTGLAVSLAARGVAAAKRLATKLREVAPELEHRQVADVPADQRAAARALANPA